MVFRSIIVETSITLVIRVDIIGMRFRLLTSSEHLPMESDSIQVGWTYTMVGFVQLLSKDDESYPGKAEHEETIDER